MTQERINVSIIEIAIGEVIVPSAASPAASPGVVSNNLFAVTNTVVAADSRTFDVDDPTDRARLNFLMKKYYAIWTTLDVEVRSVPELSNCTSECPGNYDVGC